MPPGTRLRRRHFSLHRRPHLIFAVDYDGTFAADPALFTRLIFTMQRAGHTVIVVTGRSDEGLYGDEVRAGLAAAWLDDLPIIFAGRHWKRDAAAQAGYAVDIWIDDNPEYIAPQNPHFLQHKLPVSQAEDIIDPALQELIVMLERFVSGADRSRTFVNAIEGVLITRFSDRNEIFEGLSLPVASYRPGDGESLYDEEALARVFADFVRHCREQSEDESRAG